MRMAKDSEVDKEERGWQRKMRNGKGRRGWQRKVRSTKEGEVGKGG